MVRAATTTFVGNAGNDTFNGGTGTNTVDYAVELAANHPVAAQAITVQPAATDNVGAVTVQHGHAIDSLATPTALEHPGGQGG